MTTTELQHEIFDDITKLFAKIAELQKQPPTENFFGFQHAALPLQAIKHSLDAAMWQQDRLLGELVWDAAKEG